MPSIPGPRPSRPDGARDGASLRAADRAAEYLHLSDALKQLRGVEFETHDHPAVVIDVATPPATRVWGWWADAQEPGQQPVPCVLWATERGWSATIVEAGELDGAGYERAFWSHRIGLIDLSLANALGPFPTLEELELNVAAEGSFGFGTWAVQLRSAVLWGILQLRAARAQGRRTTPDEVPLVQGVSCSVDDELARHGLVPTLAKAIWSDDPPGNDGLEILLQAVLQARRGVDTVPFPETA